MTMVTSPARRSASPLPEFTRFIGLDLSKRSLVATVDLKQHIVLQPTKVTLERFES